MPLRTRDQIDTAHLWDVASIYPDDMSWEADYAAITARLPELAACSGTLGHSGAALLAALQLRDASGAPLNRLALYASLRRDEDMTSATYRALADRAQALVARFRTATAAFTPEILFIDDATFDTFFRETPALEAYRFHLDEQRRRRAHTRSPEVEAVLAQAAELSDAPWTIFGALNDGDLSFGTIPDDSGADVPLTHSRLWLLLEHPDRALRHTALAQYTASYAAHRTTLAATLNSMIKRNCFIAQARGYSSARAAALDPDAIPLAVYDNLIATVRQHLPRFHRFVRLQQRILGVEQLYLADLTVPLTAAPPPPITYDEARELVLAALSPLGPEYVSTLRRGLFDEGWVDVYETPHKRSGAYSWAEFGTKPFILLNWQDMLSSVYTLAHEAGHSMHTVYTHQSQPYITSSYTIFVAEVASTCNEALLSAHLLRTLSDPEQRRAVLSQQLLSISGTLIWQTLFAEFEHEIHARAEQGAGLTAEDFSSIYAQLFAEYFGSDVLVDETASLVWAQVPHFYFNFYVYKYATGIAAALALASQILTEGQPAVDRYLAFLRAGSSQQSLALLQQAGVDMTTPQPIEQTLALFDSLVNQLEAIMDA